MMTTTLGLSEVSEAALTTLLRALYRKELRCPLQLSELTRFGLQYCAGALMSALRDLDERAVTVVLVCVIAERKAAEARAAQALTDAARAAAWPNDDDPGA